LSSSENCKFLAVASCSNTSVFILSDISTNTFPSLLIETVKASFSGAAFEDTELGGETSTASDGLNFVVKIKKDNNRNATSHIAVISILVLPRFILALPIIFIL